MKKSLIKGLSFALATVLGLGGLLGLSGKNALKNRETTESPLVRVEPKRGADAGQALYTTLTASASMTAEAAISKIGLDDASKKHEGKKGIINIDTISKNFKDGDKVDLEALWAKKLVPQTVGYVKVLARGSIDKRLDLDLQDYSIQAVKMVLLEGGTVKKAK